MSDKKQSIKLYTKEDFLKAAEFCEVSIIDVKYIIERINEVTDPIELPSNDEIKDEYCNGGNYKKQSSIEWLIGQLDKYYVLSFDDLKNNEAVQQAKAMHKEEIKDAYYNGGNYEDLTKNEILEIAEQFYNETFNSDEA